MVFRSCCKCSRRNFNDFRIVVIKLIHIITYPTRTSKDVGKLFAIREKLFAGLIIARRAILTTSRIILRKIYLLPSGSFFAPTVSFQQDDMSPPSISELLVHRIVMCFRILPNQVRITIPMMVSRENRTILKFDADA